MFISNLNEKNAWTQNIKVWTSINARRRRLCLFVVRSRTLTLCIRLFFFFCASYAFHFGTTSVRAIQNMRWPIHFGQPAIEHTLKMLRKWYDTAQTEHMQYAARTRAHANRHNYVFRIYFFINMARNRRLTLDDVPDVFIRTMVRLLKQELTLE